MKFEFLTNSQRGLVHGNFLKISAGKYFLYFYINEFLWIYEFCSRSYLGQSGLNRSRYNEVRFFDEFSKGLVHGNFMKIPPGGFF